MESEPKLLHPAWVFGTGKPISVECGGGDWRVSECGRKTGCVPRCVYIVPTHQRWRGGGCGGWLQQPSWWRQPALGLGALTLAPLTRGRMGPHPHKLNLILHLLLLLSIFECLHIGGLLALCCIVFFQGLLSALQRSCLQWAVLGLPCSCWREIVTCRIVCRPVGQGI